MCVRMYTDIVLFSNKKKRNAPLVDAEPVPTSSSALPEADPSASGASSLISATINSSLQFLRERFFGYYLPTPDVPARSYSRRCWGASCSHAHNCTPRALTPWTFPGTAAAAGRPGQRTLDGGGQRTQSCPRKSGELWREIFPSSSLSLTVHTHGGEGGALFRARFFLQLSRNIRNTSA